MRAITVVMDIARVVTRQCEYIIKIYSVLISPLVALLHRIKKSMHRCVIARSPFKVLSHRERASDAAMRLTEKLEHYIF